MPEPTTIAMRTAVHGRSPLAGVEQLNTVGSTGGDRHVRIVELPAMAVLQVIARSGRTADVVGAIRDALGLELPSVSRHVVHPGGTCQALWSGPSQWLLLADATSAEAICEHASRALSRIAAIVDQSSAYVMLGLSGSRVRGTLEKLVGIDVEQSAFSVGTCAMTVLAHMPIHIWRVDDEGSNPAFRIAAPQSYARSLWHHATIAAAEYGLDARTL